MIADPTPRPALPVAALQALLLVGCSLLLVRNEIPSVLAESARSTEAAHLLAAPILIALLWLRRRRVLPVFGPRGSIIGLALLATGVLVFAVSAFPFNYQQPRRLAVALLVAGAVLTAGGWRGLRFWLPMILLLALAIPIGVRYYARFIVRPESMTLEAVANTLELLPDVSMELVGLDLRYQTPDAAGVVALGEPNRGMQLPLAMLSLGVFVVFSRVRAWWQLAAAAFLAIPIVLIANYLRLVAWGVVTIALGAHPFDGRPRSIGTLVGLVAAYLGFALLTFVLDHLVMNEAEHAPAAASSPGGAP